MGNHESASPNHAECFSIPDFKEIWKKYRSSSTRSSYTSTKNMQQQQQESSDFNVNGIQRKNHEIKRPRHHHNKARNGTCDESSDNINHLPKLKPIRNNNHKRNYSHPIYYDTDQLDQTTSPEHPHFGCFFHKHNKTPKKSKSLRANLSTSTYSYKGTRSQSPSSPTTPNLKRTSTKRPIDRTQSESATQRSAAKRAVSEPRGSRTIRRASSISGVPQRTKSFNGRTSSSSVLSNGGGGRRSDVGCRSDIGPSYGRLSSSGLLNNNGHHHHVIMFSSSSGLLKPPSIDQPLECTLEELCFGCVKKMRVTRDVIASNGIITQEEEHLKINVKPGWKGGTKITFPGILEMDRPDEYAADVVFTVKEKPHPIFTREDDDLIMERNIPLVDALTGFILTIPLLSHEEDNNNMISMAIEEVIYPGYIKIIKGQGMPNQKKPEIRGDLKIKFNVMFPVVLSLEQLPEVFDF